MIPKTPAPATTTSSFTVMRPAAAPVGILVLPAGAVVAAADAVVKV